jgi:hypothetical protein
MSIESGKILNLADAQVLYNDLRGRFESGTSPVNKAENSEQLIGQVASIETGSYLYRRALHLGNRCREKVVGGMVAWNQKIENGNFAQNSGWQAVNGTITIANGEATVDVTSGTASPTLRKDNILLPKDHVVLLTAEIKNGTTSVNGRFILYNEWTTMLNINGKLIGSKCVLLKKITDYDANRMFLIANDTTSSETAKFKNVQAFDLTAEFGSTIADALLAMGEAGVAWFRERFSKDYYAYDAGSLQSVQASAKICAGKNLINRISQNAYESNGSTAISTKRCKTDIIRLKAGTYVVSGTTTANKTIEMVLQTWSNDTYGSNTRLSDSGFIDLGQFTLNTDSYVSLVFRHSDNSDVSPSELKMQLEKGLVATGYVPYNPVSHTYPFDTSLVLRGIPKLDSNNRLYYDGDEYESSGKVTRKFAIVDLGTLNWNDLSTPSSHIFRTNSINNAKVNSNATPANAIIAKYTIKGYQPISSSDDKCFAISIKNEYNYNSFTLIDFNYSDASAFTTAMSGVYLVYELATPTTEQASPFTSIMSFDPKGTEEFTEWGTRDVAIPVGHITEYLTDPAKILNNIPLIEVEKESASVVSFSDGAEGLPLKELTVKVEPVQDLHGYENPWPGGDGKNLLPLTVDGIKAGNTTGTWSGNAYTLAGITYTLLTDDGGNVIGVNVNGTATSAARLLIEGFSVRNDNLILNGTPVGGSTSTYFQRISNAAITSFFVDEGSGVTVTNPSAMTRFEILVASGVSISNKVFYPMLRLASDTDPTFAPYSNICPISGWTVAKVTRTGKNLFDYTKAESGVRIVTTTGETEGIPGLYASPFILVNPSSQYTMNFSYYSSANYGMAFYDKNKRYISGQKQGQSSSTTTPYTFTTPSGCKYVRFSINEASILQTVQMECGSTSTAFEAYNSNEYSIIFPTSAGTVYGGTVKVEKDGTGKLSVDRVIADLGDFTWVFDGSLSFYTDSINKYQSAFPKIKYATWGNIIQGAIMTQYYAVAGSTVALNDNSFGTDGNGRLYLRDANKLSMTSSEFKAAVTGVKFVYPITDVYTYDLTPVEVTTLLGINNAWSDTGNTALTYRADLAKYIDRKIAEAVANLE